MGAILASTGKGTLFISVLCICCRGLLMPCFTESDLPQWLVQYRVLDDFLEELFTKLFDPWRSVDLFPYELVILYKLHPSNSTSQVCVSCVSVCRFSHQGHWSPVLSPSKSHLVLAHSVRVRCRGQWEQGAMAHVLENLTTEVTLASPSAQRLGGVLSLCAHTHPALGHCLGRTCDTPTVTFQTLGWQSLVSEPHSC